jgi:hypothetical protein
MGKFINVCELDRKHNIKDDIFKVETNQSCGISYSFVVSRCMLHVSSTGKFHKTLTKLFDFSCLKMDPYYAIFVVVILSEYTLQNVNNT